MARRIPPITVPAALALFYLAHAYRVNTGLISPTQLMAFALGLAAMVLALQFLFKWLLGDGTKAAWMNALSVFMVLFFGDLQDRLSRMPLLAAYSGYRFLLPVLAILVVLVFLLIRRSTAPSPRSVVFPAILFSVLTLSEALQALSYAGPKGMEVKAEREGNGRPLRNPEIWYILLDEYMGNDGLNEMFGYDNGRFVQQLDSLGFQWAPHPRSQYEFTVYSMASILSRRPVTNPQSQEIRSNVDYQLALRTIRSNQVCGFLRNRGYDIVNLSIFDLPGAPAILDHPNMPRGLRLLVYNTLWGRLSRDLPHLLGKAGLEDPNDEDAEAAARNELAMQMTLEETRKSHALPRFVYLHLNMPHGPMAMDSLGRPFPALRSGEAPVPGERDKRYLQYLVHTNKVMAGFLDSLKTATSGNAVIMLASDHGYRTDCARGHGDTRYDAILATYLPSHFRFTMPSGEFNNIDQFGMLFNALFDEPFTPTPLQPWPPCK